MSPLGRPAIGISAGMTAVATPIGPVQWSGAPRRYAAAVRASGGIPLILDANLADVPALVAALDGLVLGGGGDVHPASYTAPADDPTLYDLSLERDEFEIELCRRVLERRLPLLAICRGMQIVNVAHGGTLVQNLAPDAREKHWAVETYPDAAHEVDVHDGSQLARVARSSTVAVNSFHHQAIETLGRDLIAVAHCGAVIEAIELEHRPGPMLAVQWHPELMIDAPQQRSLFEWLIGESIAAHDRTYPPGEGANDAD